MHSDTKLKIDAVARSHGEPGSMLCADWEALMTTFKAKFGAHIHDTLLPSKSYFEGVVPMGNFGLKHCARL